MCIRDRFDTLRLRLHVEFQVASRSLNSCQNSGEPSRAAAKLVRTHAIAAMAAARRLCDVPNLAEVTLSGVDPATGETIEVKMPLVRGSAGAPCIDVTKLHAATGLYTLDPGFTATSSCRSSITYIDGPRGVLLHRGYAIGELAARSSFLEVCYLLLNGRLPASEKRLKKFEVEVVRRMTVHERLKAFMTGFPDGAHPMAVMVGTVGALSAFYHRGDCLLYTSPSPRD